MVEPLISFKCITNTICSIMLSNWLINYVKTLINEHMKKRDLAHIIKKNSLLYVNMYFAVLHKHSDDIMRSNTPMGFKIAISSGWSVQIASNLGSKLPCHIFRLECSNCFKCGFKIGISSGWSVQIASNVGSKLPYLQVGVFKLLQL